MHGSKMSKLDMRKHKKNIEEFCAKHHIEKLALFGSCLTPEFKPTSDVDFLVFFDKKHIPNLFSLVDMEEELSEIIGKKADLKTPKGLSHYFRDEVISNAKIIYERS